MAQQTIEEMEQKIKYLQSRIDNLDAQIKIRENKIAEILITNVSYPEIKGWIIGPFGTPENL